MLLTKTVLKSIKTEIDKLNYRNYLYIAPQDADYPYITFSPVGNNVEYTFGQVIESINIQFSIYAYDDTLSLLDIAGNIESSFEEYKVVDGAYTIICTHNTKNKGPIPLGEDYWMLNMDYVFICQRDKV